MSWKVLEDSNTLTEQSTRVAGNFSKEKKQNQEKASSKSLGLAILLLDPNLMRAPSFTTNFKAMVCISMPMELFIKENGKTIFIMDMVNISSQMALCMWANSAIILCKALAFMSIVRAENGRVSSEMDGIKPKCKKNLLNRDKKLKKRLKYNKE